MKPYAKNARTHSKEHVAQIARSLETFGFTNPILIDGKNGVIAGHGRLQAAMLLGLKEVPTIELAGLSEAEKRAYILADNKLALNAGWDASMLRLEMADLTELGVDLTITGFSDEEIAALMADKTAGLTDPDAVPETPKEPVSVLGDVWVMGKHRLICGDSTDISVLQALTAGRDIDLVCTSPPYNQKIDGFKPSVVSQFEICRDCRVFRPGIGSESEPRNASPILR